MFDKNKFVLMLFCFLIIISISSVCASDVNGTNDNVTGTYDLKSDIQSIESGDVYNFTKDYKFDGDAQTIILHDRIITIDQDDIVINGNGFTIDAGGFQNFAIFNVLGNNVTISNLTFTNIDSGALSSPVYWQGDNGVMKNCIFYNDSSVNGGAITWTGNNGYINNCLFINNTAKDAGGAIYAKEDLTINQSSFISNSVENNGGAVYCKNRVNIYDCIFESNMANTFLTRNGCGGAIFANTIDCSLSIFKNNRAKNAGAIFAKILGADNLIFENNHAINDILSIQDSAIISSSNFTNNTASYGEIIYSQGTIIISSSFINNTATFGVVNSPTLFISSSYFDRNFAEYGGAIFANGTESSGLEFKDTIFTNNMAMKGGALYADLKINAKFSNCNFTNNTSFNEGGAIFANGTGSSGFEFEDTVFANNSGFKGGALYIDLRIQSKFSNCNFTNNTSFRDGGAVYLQRNNDASFLHCIFTNNAALNSNGGAIYNQYGEVGIDKFSVFGDSFILSVENCTFKGNYAKESGGAIFWTGLLVLKPFSYFDSNIANTGCGGAIYTEMFADTIQNITFVNNFAGNAGGAINVNRLTKDIKYSNFITNNAKYGGAIYITNLYRDSTFSHCAFIHNTGLGPEHYYSKGDVAILIYDNRYPNPDFKSTVWDEAEFFNTKLYLNDNFFFYNVAFSSHFFFEKHVAGEGIYHTLDFYSNNIKMNLKLDDNVLVDTIKLTFYLYDDDNGKLYEGDSFDMNNASFDIDSSIKVVNKEFDNNSVTLELCPQSFGSYPIKINFYGCSLSAVLNVSQSIGAFPLINIVNVSALPII